MLHQIIKRVNGIDIVASGDDENILIPITPICKALGIDPDVQKEKLQEDEFYSKVMVYSSQITNSGKKREMICLPLMYLMFWLGSISVAKVKPEAKEAVNRYRLECANAIFFHFFGRLKKINEITMQENELLKKMEKYNADKKEAEINIKQVKSQLEELAVRRRNIQPTLFD